MNLLVIKLQVDCNEKRLKIKRKDYALHKTFSRCVRSTFVYADYHVCDRHVYENEKTDFDIINGSSYDDYQYTCRNS